MTYLIHRLASALVLLTGTALSARAQGAAPQLGVPVGSIIRVQSGIRRIGTVTGVAVGLYGDTIHLTPTDKSGVGVIPFTTKVRLQIKSDSGWRQSVVTGARIRVRDQNGTQIRIGTLQLREADQLLRIGNSDSLVRIGADAHVEISEGMVAGPVSKRIVIAGMLIGGLLGAITPVDAKPCGRIVGCDTRASNITLLAMGGAFLGYQIGRSNSETEKWRAVKR